MDANFDDVFSAGLFEMVGKDLTACMIFAVGFAFMYMVQHFRGRATAKVALEAKAATSSDDAAGAVPRADKGKARDTAFELDGEGSSFDAGLLGSYDEQFSLPMSDGAASERASFASAMKSRRLVVKPLLAKGRWREAVEVIDACPEKTVYMYNAMMNWCIYGKDLATAERLMEEARQAGIADVCTYNTMMKAFVQSGSPECARQTMIAMRDAGVAPNLVTFNELLDAVVRSGASEHSSFVDTWRIVEEMQARGLQPNHVTVSILLKRVQPSAEPWYAERLVAIMDSSGFEMDEVVLGSAIEACIRVHRKDLLQQLLRKQQSARRAHVNNGHTYGSLIRAYGYLGDISRTWRTWNELQARCIPWNSVTLGNMVEVLATNGEIDAAYKLVSDARADVRKRRLLNHVVYGSVLRGFSTQRRLDMVIAVYEEMRSSHVPLSVVTYNIMVNACVCCRKMTRIPSILEDMHKDGLQPDTVTYSAIVKGYCIEGRLDQAFEVFEAMAQNSSCQPDELTYNTLIDGCARVRLYDKGIWVLESMEARGVKPSNYTVSVLVKLAHRCHRANDAFKIAEEVSQRYGFALNVHVYDSLINACVVYDTIQSGLKVFERMTRKGVRPDGRTYKVLLQACVRAGDAETAAKLLRTAFGLPGGLQTVAIGPKSDILRPSNGIPSEVVYEVLEGIAVQCRSEQMAVELFRELRRVPGLKLDPKTTTHLAAHVLNG